MQPKAARASSPNPTANLVGSRKARPTQTPRAHLAAFVIYTTPRLIEHFADFQERLAYTFARPDLLRRALTHKSFSHEAKDEAVRHNETFEFLGDSVLGFVVGDLLFRHFPELDEGAL